MGNWEQGTWAECPARYAEDKEGVDNAGMNKTKVSEIDGTACRDIAAGQGDPGEHRKPDGAEGGRAGDEKEATVLTKRMKEEFGFFGLGTFLYALFYAFCMIQNDAGIAFPFFVAGSLLYLCLSMSRLGITLKKGSAFYMGAMLLLGISTFCTDDGRIILFNKMGIFLLMMSLLLKQYYDTDKWQLGKYLGSICTLVFASLGEVGRPMKDGAAYRKQHKGRFGGKLWGLGLGLLVGVPLFLVVLLLLSSADAVFRQMTDGFWRAVKLSNVMNLVFRVAFLYFVSYGLTAYLCRKKIPEAVPERPGKDPMAAMTVTGLLTVLYLLFAGIQIAGLFLGKLTLPEGYTYAMYAREGFFQLLLVSLLNLVIVLVCMGFFKENRILKGILTVMSLCTFVMIASSAMRMVIYISFYDLTFLRLLVLWGLGVLALLFVGVCLGIFRKGFPLFRYSCAVVTVLYLALSFSHPDYIIARVNVEKALLTVDNSVGIVDNQGVAVDYQYLAGLSADAAPVLIPYLRELGYDMEAFRQENVWWYVREQNLPSGRGNRDGFGYHWMGRLQARTRNLGIRTFNLSRYLAVLGME